MIANSAVAKPVGPLREYGQHTTVQSLMPVFRARSALLRIAATTWAIRIVVFSRDWMVLILVSSPVMATVRGVTSRKGTGFNSESQTWPTTCGTQSNNCTS